MPCDDSQFINASRQIGNLLSLKQPPEIHLILGKFAAFNLTKNLFEENISLRRGNQVNWFLLNYTERHSFVLPGKFAEL